MLYFITVEYTSCLMFSLVFDVKFSIFYLDFSKCCNLFQLSIYHRKYGIFHSVDITSGGIFVNNLSNLPLSNSTVTNRNLKYNFLVYFSFIS